MAGCVAVLFSTFQTTRGQGSGVQEVLCIVILISTRLVLSPGMLAKRGCRAVWFLVLSFFNVVVTQLKL